MLATDDALHQAHTALRDKNWAEAEAISRQVLREMPTSAPALCVLGSVHSNRGDDVEALRLFRQAIASDHRFIPAYRALARMYYVLDRSSEAADIYRDWSRLEPNDPEVQHMTAAVTGMGVPLKCSEEYVQTEFNSFAQTFDEVLVDKLSYRGPEVASALVAKHSGSSAPLRRILDAGCGTGLCGPLVRKYCKILTGVDLADKMIGKAKERGCYDELVVSELCSFLKSRPETFDAIVSADVLVYFGALESVLVGAYAALTATGILVFTVEALSSLGTNSYRLQPSGRYAHREAYVRHALTVSGFSLLSLDVETVRWEADRNVEFYAVAARKI